MYLNPCSLRDMQTNVYTYYFTGADGYKFVYTKPVLMAVGLVI